MAALLASTVAAVGYVPQQTWHEGPGDAGCAPLNVLWIGLSTVLVRCASHGEVRAIARGGGVLRILDERPPPFPR